MPGASALGVFALAALALIVVPGPDVLFVVAQALERGRRAGLVSALGTATGTLVHVAAATVGLSALLASSATLFEVVKLVGAAYLVLLGVQRLLGRERPPAAYATERRGLGRVYRRAVVVAVLNPKTALFFLAFLPQFVHVGHGPAALQILTLGAVFTAIGLVSDSAYATLAGAAGSRFRGRAAERVRRYVTGTTLVGLGIAAARAER
jgi:threonine/homoserine/homoserine lactone efflux protein